MAGNSGSSFPYTALSVVLVFLTTTYLGQRGFDTWRQTDADTGKRLQLTEPPVDARLWEDPLAALDRHREKLKQCAKDGKPGAEAACQVGQAVDAEQFGKLFGKGDSVTLIAAMLPGTTLVGLEEMRRRSRYALLAGLNVEGFTPDDSERMGLLRVARCDSFLGCTEKTPSAGESAPLEIVYETLSAGTSGHAVVLWIDDTTIGRRWLSAIALLFTELTRGSAADVKLRIVGPSGSELLARALDADLAELADDVGKGRPVDVAAKWATLAKVRVISPQSTAPAEQVLPPAARALCREAKEGDCVNEFFTARLGDIADAVSFARPWRLDRPNTPFFVRTVGTDDVLARRLVAELRGRGLCESGAKKRVILIGEWDSIFARTFSQTLRDGLTCPREQVEIELQGYSYLRGLDGLVFGSAAPQAARGDAKAPVEWPEGRPQSDYVRRLVEEILKDNADKPVHAIGMIGSDVLDKLVLAQALRDAFPDRVLFTTDMDARLLHPNAIRFTRNLIVASSLPLVWKREVDTAGLLGPPKPPANRISPFRDTYQTATFLAARLAVQVDEISDCTRDKRFDRLECLVASATAEPTLFEIGRDGLAELPVRNVSAAEEGTRSLAAIIVVAVFAGLTGLMLFAYPGPAMSHARLWWSSGRQEPFQRSYAIVAGLEVAALGFAAAVVAELAVPGFGGGWGPPLSAAAAASFFWMCVYPGTPWMQSLRPSARRAGVSAAWPRFAIHIYLIVVVVMIPWSLLATIAAQDTESGMREPFAMLSGVSAWPSQLVRTLVVVLFAWFLDETWCRNVQAIDRIERKYRLFPVGTRASKAATGWARRIWNSIEVWFYWRPDVELGGNRIDGARLWQEYRRLMADDTRALRVIVWFVITVALFLVSSWLISQLGGGAYAEIPARGGTDRALFFLTVVLSAAAVIFLLVVVGDVTILTSRFVGMLKLGRTVYPADTIRRFAAELGPEIEGEATRPVAAVPSQRSDGSAPQPDRNSLLDDWIDARLLAEHTAAIGRLIVFPFILVALLVVGRSQLFDNWYIGGAVLVGLVAYVLWSIAMAALLNYDAEQARQKALGGMEADLRWLKGTSGFDKFRSAFPDLIDQIRKLREGAFAPFFEQSLVQAILVPLGGAGGVQLIDLLIHART
jgi:hypothetical protein